ncbi:MAG: hypothetical protein AABY22_34835 [Nanoarchaeota archaeon]
MEKLSWFAMTILFYDGPIETRIKLLDLLVAILKFEKTKDNTEVKTILSTLDDETKKMVKQELGF